MCPKCKRNNIFHNPWAPAPAHNLCTDCGHSWLPLMSYDIPELRDNGEFREVKRYVG